MNDYTVKIDSTLDLSQAQAQMENFLSTYDGKTLKINVDIDTANMTKSIDNGTKLLDIYKQLKSAHDGASKLFNAFNNIKSSKNLDHQKVLENFPYIFKRV